MWAKLKFFLFNNSGTAQTIAKNTFWLFFGQMMGRLLRATIVIYAARVLGAAGWGAFSYALGVAAFLTIFSDIGINALITKEASRNPELKNKYLATAFYIKLVLTAFFIIATFLVFPYLTNIPEAAAIMPILIFVFAFDTLRDLGSALTRALEKMEIEAGINIFTNAAIVALGFVFLYFRESTYSLAMAYAAGSGIGFFAIVYVLRHHFKDLRRNFTPALIKPILTTAWPFGLMGLVGAIMLNTDIIMLGWMRTPEEVGYYSAAQKLILLAYVLPGLFANSTFPAISRYAKTKPEKARSILEKSAALMMVMAVVGVIVGYLTANIVMPLLYAQKYFLIFSAPSAVANAVFNWLFIPVWGIEGAAASTIITQVIANILVW